ncbi:MAG TPA: hybrid sensor histidine kinase/response regulator, partial [Desulfobulbaceae bacterium]|nr:hybrid sensor histidine kinase/response regulator [Desulfobulbaceae bacterium]
MTEQTTPTGALPEILIVEDSPVEAEMLRRILVRANYRVTVTRNGEEGLQALREHPRTLVIIDINMPLMNGYEMCRAIKLDEKLWSIPVILVTMLSEPKDIIKALDVGADGYITKPYVEAILLGRISLLLAEPLHRKLADERRKIQVEYGGEKYNV